ncbi:MAG: hypothetical protein COA94_08485 [Rickettsiales bacterium]|nr:MAG: hypothetical protein COA94_08485 [Rickettsiales bacterium]
MKLAQSFKTLTFNGIATIAAWLATNYDVDISEENQMAITTTIMAIINILLSLFTGKRLKNKQSENHAESQNINPAPEKESIQTEQGN